MEILIKAAVIGVTGTIFAIVIRKFNGEISLLLAVALVSVIIYMAGDTARETITYIKELSNETGMSALYISPVIKTVGIAIVTEMTSKVCKDGGQSAVSSAIELIGALAAVYVAMPVVRSVLEMLRGLL